MSGQQEPTGNGDSAASLARRSEVGSRAEEVAAWYFRLNGFFAIPGFVVHPDRRQRHARTEADLIAVRFVRSLNSGTDFL